MLTIFNQVNNGQLSIIIILSNEYDQFKNLYILHLIYYYVMNYDNMYN